MRLTPRLVALVCGVWLVAGVVIAAQGQLGAALQDATPQPFAAALRAAFIQTLTWIPATLIAIVLAARFPLDQRWRAHVWIHLAGAMVLAFVTNALVVLAYWVTNGSFGGFVTLVRQGALWATLRWHVALVIYGAILAMTQGAMYYRETRRRELQLARVEGQLTRARLQALNAQIRPHFLLNTMHTIGQLWRSGRADTADEMLDRLGSLFHRVQGSTDEQEIPLADELDMVREYLAIEQARFPDRLSCTVDASPESLEMLVPPLILQPLVENAVRHGVSRSSAAGRVDVEATVNNGQLCLTVRDDGAGFVSHGGNGAGTGLRNTRERLQELYGARGRLDVEARPSGGTIVSVRLPAQGAR